MNGIDEHEDEALSPEAAAALARLRGDCAPARELWSGIESRLADGERPGRLAALAVEVQPGRELWPQIAARIHRREAQRAHAPWFAAAALAASLVLVLGLQVARERGVSPRHEPLVATAEFMAQSEPRPSPAFRQASLRPLAPETRALLRANLKILSNAEAQLKHARAADPDSAYLDRLLLATEQQKQDLHDALAQR